MRARLILGASVLAFLVLMSSGAGYAASSPVPSEPTEIGAFVDSVVWSEQSNQPQALLDLKSGTMDIYTFPLRSSADIAAAKSDPTLRTIESRSTLSDLFVNPVPTNQALAPGKINPFANRELRRALNHLLNREYITSEVLGGTGIAHTALWHRHTPEYARDPGYFRELELRYGYDLTRAQAMAASAMTSVGATLSGGYWHWGGLPIEVRFVIRTEDIRRQIGDFIAIQVEALGFRVVRDYATGARAFSIVYTGPPDVGAWHLYTEGWETTFLNAWPDEDPAFYLCGDGSAVWSYYAPTAELMDVCTRLANGQYATLAERQVLVERAAELGLEDSVRVWLLTGTTFAYSSRVTALAYDLGGGIWGPLAIRSARLSAPGGTLHVGTRIHFLSPWNPWRGFGWMYDRIQAYAFADMATVPHPHTGQPMPLRAAFSVTAPGPSAALAVPGDALVWDPSTLGFRSPSAGATAKSSATYTFTFGTWHDGSTFDMDDVLYEIALAFRRGSLSGDVHARDPDGAAVESTFLTDVIRGLKVLGPTTLQLWYDYWHPDPTAVAAIINPAFPTTPWTASELAMSTVLTGGEPCRISEVTASNEGKELLDLTKGPCSAAMEASLTGYSRSNHRPPGLSEYISVQEAKSRWSALWQFRNRTGHYYASNGPFVLEQIDDVAMTSQMVRYAAYPFPADRWDALLRPRIPQIQIGPVPNVGIGSSATIPVVTTLDANLLDEVSLHWFLVAASTSDVRLRGNPVHVGPGYWEIRLSGQMTATLTAGLYVVDAVGVGIDAAVASTDSEFVSVLGSHSPTITAIELSAVTAIAGQTVTASSHAFDVDRDVLAWTWDFGDGSTATGTTPPSGDWIRSSHAYAAEGMYTITLTVDDGHGGSATESTTVTVSPPALLRVTTSVDLHPAAGVPGKVIVDGLPRDEWGLSWMKIAPGAHTIAFSDIANLQTPPSISVTVPAGGIAMAEGVYGAMGWLRVVTDPAVPGTINVDGIPRDDWGMWIALPPGLYAVSFGSVAGYRAPPAQGVEVVAERLTTVTGVYTWDGVSEGPDPNSYGLLRVTTRLSDGTTGVMTQVIVDGIPRDEWGLSWLKLQPGEHTLSFSNTWNYGTPVPQTFTITAGGTTTLEGVFQVHGWLRVLTDPPTPGTIFVTGEPRNDWGMWQSVPPGTYTVSFGPIAGTNAPSDQVVSVTGMSLTTVVGRYTVSSAVSPPQRATVGPLGSPANMVAAQNDQSLRFEVPTDGAGDAWRRSSGGPLAFGPVPSAGTRRECEFAWT